MEETQEQTTSIEPSTSSEPTLEDVYKQFSVEEEAQQFQPQSRQEVPQQTPYQPQSPYTPDPVIDADGFKRWALSVEQGNSALRQTLQEVHGQLTQFQQERLRAKEEADISKAVAYVNETLKQDPDFVEIALGQKARKDPKFLSLYNNRDKNPKAWDAALRAMRNEFAQKFSVKTDSQLAENQRALRTAQQTSATTKPEPSGDNARFEGKIGRDFEAEWSRYVSSGY